MKWLKNLTPWRCTPVLPTVYEDSLSYLEMVCKLIKAVDTLSEHLSAFENTIIEQIGQLSDRIDQLDPAGESGRGNVYVLDIGEVVPGGELVAVDDAKFLELGEALTDGKDILCRCTVTAWPGLESYNGTVTLPLTCNIQGGGFYNFSGIVSPYPFSGGVIYDVNKSWVATLGMTGRKIGLTVVKLNEVSKPVARTGATTSSGLGVVLSGDWEFTGASANNVSGKLVFTNKTGVTVATLEVSAGVGSVSRVYVARAVDGLVSDVKTNLQYTRGNASDGDNEIVAVKWTGTGDFNYTVV